MLFNLVFESLVLARSVVDLRLKCLGESQRRGGVGEGVKLVGRVGRREINETQMNESDEAIKV